MESKDAALAGCLAVLVLAPLLMFLEAWWVMLLLGAIHHDVWAPIPAFGFWQTVLIVLAANAFGTLIRGVSSSKESK